MNKLLRRAASVAAAVVLTAGVVSAAELTANYEVIPLPQRVMPSRGLPFVFNQKTVIVVPKGSEPLKKNAELLAGYLKELTGVAPRIVNKTPKKNAIVLEVSSSAAASSEAYALNVTSDKITISGASPAGTFYGIQTLRKSIPTQAASGDELVFPAVEISDAPRFGYRGAHFDTSRHFFPVDSVKSFIDMLALHNINRFHWHITDDQGWRLEIKKYPGLTEVGSKRAGTVVGRNSGEFDGIPYGGYYTQEEARDIVKYAADRHITVIPEIDLPGHMLGALAAYPELGCTGGPYEVWQQWGVAKDVLCAGNDKTLEFIDDVLREVMDIFPSEYIHIGGDECPKDRWEKCPKCQARIESLGLKSDSHSSAEQKLQNFVMERAAKTLASRDRKMIGWDEILEGGLFPGATVMAWRGAEAAAESAKQGHDAILTPTNFCYFDYYQSTNPDLEPLGIGGYVPVEKVYSLEPVSGDLTPDQAKHIIGAQANLWTEYMPTYSHVQFMELPRLAAMSEVQWTDPAQKDYAYFSKRLPQLIEQYKTQGYNYAPFVFDVLGRLDSDPANHAITATLTTIDDAPIYYTLDGSTPTETSNRYSGPVSITESAVIRAVVIRPDGRSHEWSDSVSFNKATSSTVTLKNPPHSRYASFGPGLLTDGRFGGEAFNTGKWLGFNGENLEATIDLGKAQEISTVSYNALVATADWIFDTQEAFVEVSDNGTDFTPVASATYTQPEDHITEIRTHTLKFEPVKARYVRVKLTYLDDIPVWHGAGIGKPAFIFVDEIMID